MSRTIDEIEADIAHTQRDLSSNLATLGNKIKGVGDWKQHFHKHPLAMVGIAVGGGIALAALFAGRSAHPREQHSTGRGNAPAAGTKRDQVRTHFDQITSALIGVAATRAADFIGSYLPGFQDHIPQTSRARQGPG